MNGKKSNDVELNDEELDEVCIVRDICNVVCLSYFNIKEIGVD